MGELEKESDADTCAHHYSYLICDANVVPSPRSWRYKQRMVSSMLNVIHKALIEITSLAILFKGTAAAAGTFQWSMIESIINPIKMPLNPFNVALKCILSKEKKWKKQKKWVATGPRRKALADYGHTIIPSTSPFFKEKRNKSNKRSCVIYFTWMLQKGRGGKTNYQR